jgi:hypothetical protein
MTNETATFILQKALKAHFRRMRGALLSLGSGALLCAAMFSPEAVYARETEQGESANCTDPKHRHYVLRPLTEPVAVRKKDKVRVRRVLM